MDVHGFQEENIQMLIDDKAYTRPTRMNITKAFKKLVNDSQPGDTCFVHFSGHGGKIKDYDGDEGRSSFALVFAHGANECLYISIIIIIIMYFTGQSCNA